MRRVLAVLAAAVVLLGSGALTQAATSSAAPAQDWVVKAQKRLDALHCSAGPADGEVGPWTRSAVIRFQSREGIRQTGHLDRRTRQALYADDAPRCDVRPVPPASGKGRRIVVSQRQNWVWLVGPKGVTIAQGGIVDNPSVLRRGAYATGSYCGRAARIKLNSSLDGTEWLDDFVRFAPCGIGFHRIPRHKSNGHQIHPDWVLRTDMAASHGCIRLSKSVSRRVWTFTTRRTAVRVV